MDWTCNALEPRPTVTSSPSYDATNLPPDNVATGIPECRGYAVLDRGCTADGSWYAIPPEDLASTRLNPGWWSATTSNANREFSDPPYVEVWYPESRPRKAGLIHVAGARRYGGLGRVRIHYRATGASDWTLLGEYDFDGWYVEAQLPSVLELRAVRVSVLRTAEPNDYARIYEVDALWREEFREGAVSRLDVTRRLEYLAAVGYPLGTVAASEVQAEILVDDPSAYALYLQPGARLLPYWGLLTSEGWEWVGQGAYFADEWAQGTGMLKVRGRDRMGLMALREMPPRLLHRLTLGQALRHVAHYAWVHDDDVVVDSSVDTDPYEWIVMQGSPAEATNELARASLHHVWFGVGGELHIRRRTAVPAPGATISDAEILGAPELRVQEVATRVIVDWRAPSRAPCQDLASVDAEELTGEAMDLAYSKSPAVAVSGLDFTGTVSDLLCDEWECTVTASGGQEDERLKVLGQPLALTERSFKAEDEDLVRRLGSREIRLDCPVWAKAAGQGFAERILSYLSAFRYRLDLELPPYPHWEPGDVITLDSDRLHLSGDYLVISISLGAGDVMRVGMVEV